MTYVVHVPYVVEQDEDRRGWSASADLHDDVAAFGESVAQAAVRETREESGTVCEITGIVGIYSDPKHEILYASLGTGAYLS